MTSLVSHSDASALAGCWAGLGPPASSLSSSGLTKGHVLTLLPQWFPLGEPRQASGTNSPRRQAAGTWADLPTAWLAARTHPWCRRNSDRPKQKAKVRWLDLWPVVSRDHTAGRKRSSGPRTWCGNVGAASTEGLGVGWLWFSSTDAPEGGQQGAESFV